MDQTVRRRVWLTVAILAATAVAASWSWQDVFQMSFWPRSLSASAMGPMSLGITPYLGAAGWVLLFSGAFSRLGALRDGTESQRELFDRIILGAGVLFAFAFAGLHVRALQLIQTTLGHEKLALSNSILASIQVGMFALTVLAATTISRFGFGNGAALLYTLLALVLVLPGAGESSLQLLQQARVTALPVAQTTLLATLAICIVYMRKVRTLRMLPTESEELAPRPPLEFPLRMNLVGAVPLALLGLVQTVVIAFMSIATPEATAPPVWLWLESPAGWALHIVLIVAFSFVLTSIWFDTREVGAVLARWGYRLDGAGELSSERFLDRLIERQTLLSCGFLIALDFAPVDAIHNWTGVNLPPALSGAVLLTLCAVVMDTARHLSALRSMHRSPHATESEDEGDREPTSNDSEGPGIEEAHGWSEVLEAETELEARLAASVLESAGIQAVVLANRAMPVLGTLALWEWCAPTYRAWTMHPRLAGGRVAVMVPSAEADRARDLLSSRLASDDEASSITPPSAAAGRLWREGPSQRPW